MEIFYPSLEKKYVHEMIWLPTYIEISRTKKKFIFLEFPGYYCEFVKLIVQKEKIAKVANGVYIEFDRDQYTPIQTTLASLLEHVETEQLDVINGDISDLMKNSINDIILKRLPFDIINFDPYGPFTRLNTSEESDILNALERLIHCQALKINKFHIFTTFEARFEIGGPLQQTHFSCKDFLWDTIIKDQMEELKNSQFDILGEGFNIDDDRTVFTHALAIMLKIIDFGDDEFSIELCDNPVTYTGTTEGYTAKMVCHHFIAKKPRSRPVRTSFWRELKIKNKKDALEKCKILKNIRINNDRCIAENLELPKNKMESKALSCIKKARYAIEYTS